MKLESNQPLNYYLSKSTIPQLKAIAKEWELKGISSSKKADIVSKLDACIKENVLENSKSWPAESHSIIATLTQNNGMLTLSQSTESYDFLEKLAVIHKEIEKDKITYLLSSDITNEFSIDIAEEVAATVDVKPYKHMCYDEVAAEIAATIEDVAPFIDRRPILSTTPRHVLKTSRNDKCPCGSGMKYKFCCGK